MSKFIVFCILILSISSTTSNQQSKKVNKTLKTEITKLADEFTVTDELYTLKFKIETTKKNKHNLVVAIELHNGSHFISPNATREFKGKFYMDLGSYKDLSFDGNIIETPRSVEENDPHPFTNGLVNWVRVNTTYTQPLNIKTEDDFEVFGRVIFTIEPRCSLEQIPFGISYKDGKFLFFDPKC